MSSFLILKKKINKKKEQLTFFLVLSTGACLEILLFASSYLIFAKILPDISDRKKIALANRIHLNTHN